MHDPTDDGTPVEIGSRDYWFKVIEMLQQNWALIDEVAGDGVVVYFLNDASGVFDEIPFATTAAAEAALRKNGFGKYYFDAEAQKFIAAPEAPFRRTDHANGPIYSSGRFWID